MYYKEVSDLDYGYNQVTGEYDVPSIEWSTDMGRFWSRYNSEDERQIALEENEAYNNQPEVKAYIEAEAIAEDLCLAEVYSNDLFEDYMNKSQTVALKDVLSYVGCFSDTIKKRVTELVCLHNKLIMRARVQPIQATFTIGDLF